MTRALELYLLAADAESNAVDSLDKSKSRTLGISVISAVSLYYKAHSYSRAEQFAYHWMSSSLLPLFAIDQLRSLLQTVWSDDVRSKSSIKFTHGEVLVSVKGGDIVTGGAPLDLIVSKVEGIQSLFYRTTEMLKGMPHRKHGGASPEIQQLYRPWLFQTPPGSYQFAVAIQKPTQEEIFPRADITSENISTMFLQILRAAINDPDDSLTKIVPDPEYRGTFLKLARNLAPSGKTFDELEVSSPQEAKPITISLIARKTISDSLKRQFPKPRVTELIEETLTGILRAVHLDEDWLEVTVEGEHIRVYEARETVDDVVGPMVNHQVIVQSLRKPNGQHILVDIQASE